MSFNADIYLITPNNTLLTQKKNSRLFYIRFNFQNKNSLYIKITLLVKIGLFRDGHISTRNALRFIKKCNSNTYYFNL